MSVPAYVLAVLIAIVSPARRVITDEQGLKGGWASSIFAFQILFLVSLLFLTLQPFAVLKLLSK